MEQPPWTCGRRPLAIRPSVLSPAQLRLQYTLSGQAKRVLAWANLYYSCSLPQDAFLYFPYIRSSRLSQDYLCLGGSIVIQFKSYQTLSSNSRLSAACIGST